VNAQITGNAVIIHGRVTGDVAARKRLEIRAPGRWSATSPRRAS
jgi:cytoskeletal protein CcmA (bactofilin family)